MGSGKMIPTYTKDTPRFDGRVGGLQGFHVLGQSFGDGVGIVLTEPLTKLLLLFFCVGREPVAWNEEHFAIGWEE